MKNGIGPSSYGLPSASHVMGQLGAIDNYTAEIGSYRDLRKANSYL